MQCGEGVVLIPEEAQHVVGDGVVWGKVDLRLLEFGPFGVGGICLLELGCSAASVVAGERGELSLSP